MMKKISMILMALFFIFGCKAFSPTPQEVIIKIISDSPTTIKIPDNEIRKGMEVKNPEGELSSISFIQGDVGYIKLWGSLTSHDSSSLWSDLLLFEKVYKVKSLNIYISTGGGGAFSGLALSDEIERISKKIPLITYASGIVASAAVPVFASGSKRIASKGAIFMVHMAKSFKYLEESGEKDAMAEVMMFKLLKKRYLEKLSEHSKLSIQEWQIKLEEITWFDAQQAKEWGLLDEII